jgi:hydrogenase small subunit
MSFLDADQPSVVDLVVDFGLEVIWHPSISVEMGEDARQSLNDCVSGKRHLDVLVFEGTVIQGPDGSGHFDMFAGRPMKDWLTDLVAVADIVVAIGDCATFGGLPAVDPNPTDSTGLQFLRSAKGGFLGADWVSKSGFPVINIPGCPAHPDWITQILVALATGRAEDLALDEFNRPQTFFKTFTHSGCIRNYFYEFKESTKTFGEGTRKGCLFYDLGCRGPMTYSPCNRILWNGQASKTRVGMPCLGCTEPEFPHGKLEPGTIFKERRLAGVIPGELTPGENHLGYLVSAVADKVSAPKWAKKDMFVV